MQLNHKKYGDSGPNLVIIHGIFGSLDNWHTVALELGTHFQVNTLDMRNHGRSPHSNDMSIALMVEDVLNFCEACDLDEIHLIGHSMGGKVAMAFAQTHPELLAKLIVVDIAPKTYKAAHLPYFEGYENIQLDSIRNRKELDAAFMEYEDNFAVRQFLMKNIVSNGAGGYQVKINVQGIKNGYEEIVGALALGTINTRTLFIKGANSNYISKQDETQIGRHFSDYRIESIANSGHWVHAENRTDFIQTLEQFIQA